MQQLLLVRPAGELAIKGSRIRKQFTQALKVSLGLALERRSINHRVVQRTGRLFVETDAAQAACAAVARVCGVSSLSLVELQCAAELDEIVARAGAQFASAVANRRYAVRCRRQGSHSFRSGQIERQLGAALNQAGASVDLTEPEVTVWVEVLGPRALVFANRINGPGGLPPAVEGRAVALMSGGFDSAVAAWRCNIELSFVRWRDDILPLAVRSRRSSSVVL